MQECSFTEAIRLATEQAMLRDPRVHVLGLGVTYPNGADGTTGGLRERFNDRVHDIPVSENAVTGMAVGMAACGLRPIVHHGRIEFAYYAVDPIVTQAANWNYMFGGDYPVPLTVRVAMGRQWGNGPQHTRSNRALFGVPGLKVVCPATPRAAKALLLAAVDDPNPVVYLEHRWLYKTRGEVDEGPEKMALDKAQVLRSGKDITIVAVGDMVLEALRAAQTLETLNIEAEVIDLVSVYPVDPFTIQDSVRNHGRLLVVDAATPAFSVGHEVMNWCSPYATRYSELYTLPDTPCPTAPAMTAGYYQTDEDIVRIVATEFGLEYTPEPKTFDQLNLAPNTNFDTLLGKEAVSR